jgi:hypothetical protein
MQMQNLTLATVYTPVVISLDDQPKVVPYLYVHVYQCIFNNGSKDQFEFELPSEVKLSPGQFEEWRASNIREVHQRRGIPLYSNGKAKSYLYGKMISEIKLIPQLYCNGKFIDTYLF